MRLAKLWKNIETALKHASSKLPSPPSDARAEFDAAIAEFREFLDHNELELAMDALVVAAELTPVSGGVWRDFERAAEMMKLDNRAADFRRRFILANGQ